MRIKRRRAPGEWKRLLHPAEVRAQVTLPGDTLLQPRSPLIVSESQRGFLLAYSPYKIKPESLRKTRGKGKAQRCRQVDGVSKLGLGMEIGGRFGYKRFLDPETNAHEEKGNPRAPLLISGTRLRLQQSPGSRDSLSCAGLHPRWGGGEGWPARVLPGGAGSLGPGLKRGWEMGPQIFPWYWLPQSRAERGSEKTRRPEGHVKLKVYKLKGKIQRIELPNFTNLLKVNSLVECTVPLGRRQAARLTGSPVLGRGRDKDGHSDGGEWT